ncbi:MAG: hypothetical protein ACYCUI_14035 [Vulcanimicrobiaceae bacterium]
MDRHVRTLYLLRLRDAIADKEWTIAQANRQLHACGDWSCDWGIPMAAAQEQVDECVRALQENGDG